MGIYRALSVLVIVSSCGFGRGLGTGVWSPWFPSEKGPLRLVGKQSGFRRRLPDPGGGSRSP